MRFSGVACDAALRTRGFPARPSEPTGRHAGSESNTRFSGVACDAAIRTRGFPARPSELTGRHAGVISKPLLRFPAALPMEARHAGLRALDPRGRGRGAHVAAARLLRADLLPALADGPHDAAG